MPGPDNDETPIYEETADALLVTPPLPGDGDGDAFEGNLGTVTDIEWQAAHHALTGKGIPTRELAYTWSPVGPVT